MEEIDLKIKDIDGCSNLEKFVIKKLEKLDKGQKDFEALFNLMFEQEQNVMAEKLYSFRIKKTTYGQSKKNIIDLAGKLKKQLGDVESGAVVGLYLDNGIEWIETFWAILKAL